MTCPDCRAPLSHHVDLVETPYVVGDLAGGGLHTVHTRTKAGFYACSRCEFVVLVSELRASKEVQ